MPYGTCSQGKQPDRSSERIALACCLQIFPSPAQGLAAHSPQSPHGPAPRSARSLMGVQPHMPRSSPDSARAQVCAQSSVVATQTTQPAKQRTSTIQPCTGTVCRPQDWTDSSWKKGTVSSVSELMSSKGQDGSWSHRPESDVSACAHRARDRLTLPPLCNYSFQ